MYIMFYSAINSILSSVADYFNNQATASADHDTDSLKKVLTQLNAEFAVQEARAPAQGYRVVFEDVSTFKAKLIPMGALRTTEHLTGIPEKNQGYDCPFCKAAVKTMKVYDDHSRAILSLSGQILLIPGVHYTHWFTTPIDEQLKLLKHALELRKIYPDAQGQPMELHCGSKAYQTVFHTHLRTGIFAAAGV